MFRNFGLILLLGLPSSFEAEELPEPPVEAFLNVLDEARQFYRSKKYLEALVAFRIALAHQPENASILLPVGVCAYRIKRYSLAIQSLRQGIEFTQEPELLRNLKVWLVRSLLEEGDRMEKNMRWEEAIAHWKEALEWNEEPRQAERLRHRIHQGHFAHGSYHFSLEHHLEAALAFADILLDQPEEELVKRIRRMGVNLFLNGARWCLENQMPEEARRLYDCIVQHYTGYRVAYEEAQQYLSGDTPDSTFRNLWDSATASDSIFEEEIE